MTRGVGAFESALMLEERQMKSTKAIVQLVGFLTAEADCPC